MEERNKVIFQVESHLARTWSIWYVVEKGQLDLTYIGSLGSCYDRTLDTREEFM